MGREEFKSMEIKYTRVKQLFEGAWMRTIRFSGERPPADKTGLTTVKIMLRILCVFLVLSYSFAQRIDVYKRPRQVERSRDYDVQHYRLELAFDLEAKRYRGSNTVTFSPLKDGFQRCILDAEELTVTSVKSSENTPLAFEQTDRHLIICFPHPFRYGGSVSFTIDYQGHDPRHGLFFDEQTPQHPRMVSTVSWPEYAHHWFPCYDYPHDKATHDIIVTVKTGLKVLSNGRLMNVEDDPQAGTSTFHWSQELPHSTYLVTLAIGPFAVIEDSLGALPVSYWVYPKDVEDAQWIFAKTPAMIDYYSKLFGYDYPWAQYAQVVSPRMGGGAENTSATTLGEQVIHDRHAEQDFSWERIIAHEIAHQWWGDLITLRTWSQTWMNESFATYADYLWTRHAKGEDEGAHNLEQKKNQYLREARTRYIRPIVFDRYDRPQDNFDSHTYPKGAAVLHMLRFVMGEAPFFAALKHFLHKHAFQAVDTHDFMTAVKEASGQNLDWFFDQCLFKPGHPVFEIGSAYDEPSRFLRVSVRQVQDFAASIPVYTLPVIIGITTPAAKESHRVWIKQKEQEFVFSVSEEPLMVRFDEGNHLLKEWTFDKGLNELLVQLENDDVIGRSWAAGELVKFKNQSRAVTALKAGAQTDPFWAVRESAIEALREIKPRGETEFFKQLSLDTNSRVRAAALKCLGDYQDPALAAFFQTRFKEDNSYLAQAEALRSIGRCGDRAELGFLKQAAKIASPRNVIKNAAEGAIKEILKRSSHTKTGGYELPIIRE